MIVTRHLGLPLSIVVSLFAGCSGGHDTVVLAASVEPSMATPDFLRESADHPDTIPEAELVAQVRAGRDPAAMLVALRLLQGRGGGVTEAEALLDRQDTSDVLRLNALAGLVRMRTEESGEAVRRIYAQHLGEPIAVQLLQLLGEYGDEEDAAFLRSRVAEGASPEEVYRVRSALRRIEVGN
ncbi:MAG: hypothetical protein HY722_10220 [Planctomycetes bacterium]|nr:hypothetical protein [Planctomycetota bacterium]